MTERRRSGRSELRVLQVVCSRRFSGVERYVSTIADELAAKGHSVTVLTSVPERVRAEIVGPGVVVERVEWWRDAARQVRALAPAVDVIHTHLSAAELAATFGLVGQRAVPLVTTRHFARERWSTADGQGRSLLRGPGLGVDGRRDATGFVRRQVLRRVAGRIDRQLAVSRFVADRIDGESSVLHPGVPEIRDERSVRKPVVLVVERLEPGKQTDVALAAWGASSLRHRGWSLHVLGDGSERPALERRATVLGVSKSVVWHGHVTDVRSRMRSASLLLATARSAAFPLSVVEAMAAGTPVVAAAGGGHLESVGAVPGAALFEPGDAVGAARLLDRLGERPDERERLAAAQHEHQQRHLRSDAHADALVAVYDAVRSERARRR